MFYAILKETDEFEAEVNEFFSVKEAIEFTLKPENVGHNWIIVQDYTGNI